MISVSFPARQPLNPSPVAWGVCEHLAGLLSPPDTFSSCRHQPASACSCHPCCRSSLTCGADGPATGSDFCCNNKEWLQTVKSHKDITYLIKGSLEARDCWGPRQDSITSSVVSPKSSVHSSLWNHCPRTGLTSSQCPHGGHCYPRTHIQMDKVQSKEGLWLFSCLHGSKEGSSINTHRHPLVLTYPPLNQSLLGIGTNQDSSLSHLRSGTQKQMAA